MSPAELADNGDRYHIDEFFNRFGGWAWVRWPEIAAALRRADTDRARLATAEAERDLAQADADRLADYLRPRSGSQLTKGYLLRLHAADVAQREHP